jgi:hypothetical protein
MLGRVTLYSQSTTRLQLPSSAAVGVNIGRREVFLWVGVCLVANQALQLVDTRSFEAFFTNLANQNFIYWLACYAFIWRLWISDGRSRASSFDGYLALATLTAVFLTSFVTYRVGLGLVATTTAAYLLIAHGGERNLKAAGAVLLAISAHLVWGPIFFKFFTPELLLADAALVGEILKLLRPDITWSGTSFQAPDGHTIALMGSCSSFSNVSTALLACATVIMLTRTEWVRRDIATIAIATVVMILTNAARLCLVGWSSSQYLFWHEGAGAPILGICQLLIVLVIAWYGAAPRRSRHE